MNRDLRNVCQLERFRDEFTYAIFFIHVLFLSHGTATIVEFIYSCSIRKISSICTDPCSVAVILCLLISLCEVDDYGNKISQILTKRPFEKQTASILLLTFPMTFTHEPCSIICICRIRPPKLCCLSDAHWKVFPVHFEGLAFVHKIVAFKFYRYCN